MKRNEMAQVMDDLHMQEHYLRTQGQQEYAHDEGNAFRNFEWIGEYLDIPREKVLLVYFLKHVDGIVSYVNGHKMQREGVEGRIGDARVYLALLMGMILENDPKYPSRFDEETDHDRAD